MSGGVSRFRSEQVLVRLTPDEAAEVARLAAERGWTKAELVRHRTLRGDVELMGGGELARLLGGERPLTKQQVWHLARKPGFPEPLARLSNGPVWDAAEVRDWKRRRDETELSTGLRTAVDGVKL